jgi:hypothetical protein
MTDVPGSNLQPGPGDTWALDNNDYSPDKFYTKSTDGRGNSELLNVKVSPFVFGIIAELVESPDFPDYKTKADVVRDALVHRLYHVRKMAKDPRVMASLQHRANMMMREAHVERIKNEMIQEERFTGALIEAMEIGVNSGNVMMTADAIEAAHSAMDHLPFNLADRLRRAVAENEKLFERMKARAAVEVGEMERHA